MDCIFCKIIAGEIPSKKLFADDSVYAFADIDPKAPFHALIVPRRHVDSMAELNAGEADAALLGHLLATAGNIAREQKLDKGYRVVINTREDGGQTVDHLHLHLMGGRAMHWPPG
ncbi:histidine triad nucleotide-binding protein [Silvibacterium acidisoli]|uniref:histidine triad nucleotide-binding protein n=1 Tax=Acidobacteriaceae bacterium ZG23-2 TaxID=2883246 RepID=UPI00406CB785